VTIVALGDSTTAGTPAFASPLEALLTAPATWKANARIG